MKIELDYNKSLEENASLYFEKSKKARVKSGRIALAIKETEKKLGKAKQSQEQKETAVFKKRTRSWFEKFHWFFTSEGFMVIGGRDAKSNETIVKKLMKKEDVYFHADVHGAPHTILVTGGKKPSEKSLDEAAIFAASFSKAWAEKISAVDVYSAKPEQVSKSAPTGESIGTGAFMIYGKRDWFKKTPLDFAMGFKEKEGTLELVSGPKSAVKKNSDFLVKIVFGKASKGEIAKQIRGIFSKKLGKKAELSEDDLISLLPSGSLKIQE